MNNLKLSKLQYLLIKQLLKDGSVELLLPCGMTLEIGITQEDKNGDQVKVEDYCYVVASDDRRSVLIDNFNLGLQFEDQDDTILFDDTVTNENGVEIRRVEVV